MYRLDHDPVANVLHIMVAGFWDLRTAATFSVAAVAKGGMIRLQHGDYAIVVDARDLPIQSGIVADANRSLLPKARLLTRGPIAIVAGNTLSKLQNERIFSEDRLRHFTDHDQALGWIDAEWTMKRAA